jgi:hypothetical protein
MGTSDLHNAFREPTSGIADTLTRFLEDADRLAGIRATRLAALNPFELDYGATILPEAGHGADVVTARRRGLTATRAESRYPGSRPAAASASRRFSYTRPSTSLPSRRRHTQPAGASITRPTPQA